MPTKRLLKERELTALAKEYRIKSGLNKAEAASEFGVSRSTLHLAEENPEESLTKLRCRMIEKFSSFKVDGPLFQLQRK